MKQKTIEEQVYHYLSNTFGDKFVGHEHEFLLYHTAFMKEQERKNNVFKTALERYMKNGRYMSPEDQELIREQLR